MEAHLEETDQVSEAAARHGASVERETSVPEEAYAAWPKRQPTRYRPRWLPGGAAR